MTDEDAFIRAIQANPDDKDTWFVYADWLEEHRQRVRAENLRRWAAKEQRPGWYADRAWTDLVAGRVPLWDSPTLLALGRLEGLLLGYSEVNEHRNNFQNFAYAFMPSLVRPAGPLAEQVRDQFPECYRPVSLEEVLDWQTVQKEILTRWMFDSLRNLQPGPDLAFRDEERRNHLVDTLLRAIGEVIQPRTAWRIQITENRFYAVSWDDFVLQADDRLLFLHFSFSD
jgi:uncharacterized protein (TIGR02996 family)